MDDTPNRMLQSTEKRTAPKTSKTEKYSTRTTDGVRYVKGSETEYQTRAPTYVQGYETVQGPAMTHSYYVTQAPTVVQETALVQEPVVIHQAPAARTSVQRLVETPRVVREAPLQTVRQNVQIVNVEQPVHMVREQIVEARPIVNKEIVYQQVAVPQPYLEIEEKLVTEAPTEINYVTLDKPQSVAVEAPPPAAPLMFAEKTTEASSGWPWWAWFLLSMLCCLLPLLAVLGIYHFCKKKPTPKSVEIDKKPEISAAPKTKIAKVVEEPEPRPTKQFVYEKKEIDQEEEIEREIQKELERSRIRKTETREEKEKKNVVVHHPRSIESNRRYEEGYLDPYYRGATYDVVNRSPHKYQDLDDSYVIKQHPERVSRVVQKEYAPGIVEVNSRPSRIVKETTVIDKNADGSTKAGGGVERYIETYAEPVSVPDNRKGAGNSKSSSRTRTQVESQTRVSTNVRADEGKKAVANKETISKTGFRQTYRADDDDENDSYENPPVLQAQSKSKVTSSSVVRKSEKTSNSRQRMEEVGLDTRKESYASSKPLRDAQQDRGRKQNQEIVRKQQYDSEEDDSEY